jgi:hypothetical protein
MFALAIDIWRVARSLTLRTAIFFPVLHLARAVGMSTFFAFNRGHGEFPFSSTLPVTHLAFPGVRESR